MPVQAPRPSSNTSPLYLQRVEAWRQSLPEAHEPPIRDVFAPTSLMLKKRPKQPQKAPLTKMPVPLARTARALSAWASALPKLVLTPIAYGAGLALAGLMLGLVLGLVHGYRAVRDNALPGPLRGLVDAWCAWGGTHDLRSDNSDVSTLSLE